MTVHFRTMSGSMTLVDLKKVSVRAGAVRILDDVTVTIAAGEAVGIRGLNGSGKTTLLRLLATLHPLSGGSGTVLGADLDTSDKYDVRCAIGYIGHQPGLYPELTLLENLSFVARSRGLTESDARESLRMVGLEGAIDRPAGHTSHGMQRRAEFARLLMTQPTLLLLDEPHSALDADAVELVDGLVDRTLDRGGAAVLVSHQPDRLASLVGRTYEIRGGTLR